MFTWYCGGEVCRMWKVGCSLVWGVGMKGWSLNEMTRVAAVLHDLTAYGLHVAAELKMSGVKKNGKGDRRATVPCKQKIFYLRRRFKLHGWN